MPRKKAGAAAAAGAQDTVDSLRAKLDEQREHYEAQSAQALKLLEQKDAELAALRDSTATPVSPGTDASQAASQEAERLRRDAEAKKKEAEILQRARSESAAELARLRAEVAATKSSDAARQAAVVASNAAVDELKRLRGTAATDKAALATTAKALDELSKTEKDLRAQLAQSTQDLAQAQQRLQASQHNSDATQAEAERADTAEAALKAAKANNEKLTKRLGALERSDAATTQREANAAEAIEKARALQEQAQAQMREASSLQQAAKRDGAAELARALDARDLRRRLSLAEADRDAALRDAEDLRTALKTQEPPEAPSMPPVTTFTKSTDDGGTVAELASSLTEAHEQLDLCRSSLDAMKGSDEDIRARCCSLTQRLHEEAGERNRLERLRARCRCSQQDGAKDANEDVTRRALAAALAAQAAKDSLFAEQQATANKALAAARCRATVAERARDLADARASDASEALQEALSLHGIDRSALADRLPEREDTTLGATAKALDEAERRINAERERSAILEKRLVEMTSQKADAVEALERETASMRAQADRAAAAELASVAVQAASRSGAGLRSSPRWRSYVDDVLSACSTERDAKAALLESRAGLARLEARLETSERRADSLQYRLARRGVEEEEEDFHVTTPKDPEISSLRREALQLADEAQQAREAQKRSELQVREAQGALSALRLEKSSLEARCAASEAAQAEATKSSLDLRARAAQAEARAVHRVTSTDDDAKALAQAVLARMDKIQNMATTDDSSEALQTLEKRASELETALNDAQQRLNDESTAKQQAERRAGREASQRADMEVEVARLKEDLRSLKSAKNLEVLAEAARLEARAEDADKRAELACEDAETARAKLAEAEKNLGRLEGAGVLAEEARKRADAASQRAKAAEDRCRLAVESAQQKAQLAEKRASDAERNLNEERQRSTDALKREEALRTQSRKDLNDVRNDAKRQRKVFQDFRKEKDDLQKRYDKQHAELLESKSRQATLKLRVGALQTASQSKSPRREVVEKDRLRAEEDAQRKRTDEAARRRLRDIRQQKDEMAHEKRILEEKMSTIIAREEKAEHRRGEAVVRERAAHRKLTVAQDAFEREKTVLTRKLDEAKAMLGRKSADYDQARAARLRTARRADALGNAIKDVGVRLARGLDRARDRAAQLASTSSTPTAGLVAASLLDLAPSEVDQLIASLDGSTTPVSRSPRHANAESAFAATIASALEATDYVKIRESIVAVVDERVEHERNLGMALGSRDDAPVQSRRPVVQADDCSVDAVDAAGVLEALGLSTEVC